MTSGTDNSSSQTDFFELSSSQTSAHPHFAELCNALYERELLQLATYGPSQIQLLRRRLSDIAVLSWPSPGGLTVGLRARLRYRNRGAVAD